MVIKHTEQEIQFQLKFKYQDRISIGFEFDKIKIELLDTSVFISKETLMED